MTDTSEAEEPLSRGYDPGLLRRLLQSGAAPATPGQKTPQR